MLALAAFGVAMFAEIKGYTVTVTAWQAIAITAAYLIVYYLVKLGIRIKRTRSIKAMESEYDTTFTALVKEEIEKNPINNNPVYLKSFAKKYHLDNERRVKRGL